MRTRVCASCVLSREARTEPVTLEREKPSVIRPHDRLFRRQASASTAAIQHPTASDISRMLHPSGRSLVRSILPRAKRAEQPSSCLGLRARPACASRARAPSLGPTPARRAPTTRVTRAESVEQHTTRPREGSARELQQIERHALYSNARHLLPSSASFAINTVSINFSHIFGFVASCLAGNIFDLDLPRQPILSSQDTDIR